MWPYTGRRRHRHRPTSPPSLPPLAPTPPRAAPRLPGSLRLPAQCANAPGPAHMAIGDHVVVLRQAYGSSYEVRSQRRSDAAAPAGCGVHAAP